VTVMVGSRPIRRAVDRDGKVLDLGRPHWRAPADLRASKTAPLRLVRNLGDLLLCEDA
jgi:hypothetical protein